MDDHPNRFVVCEVTPTFLVDIEASSIETFMCFKLYSGDITM